MDEYFFRCPYCWKEISMLVDLSVGEQSYVEDCENCCNPIDIYLQTDLETVICFVAEKSQ